MITFNGHEFQIGQPAMRCIHCSGQWFCLHVSGAVCAGGKAVKAAANDAASTDEARNKAIWDAVESFST
jgi:hypothetical protein